ncbi:MAG: NUDIX domain-containing protein [Planctomycetia bacterium]|nr:NUDIX domain-containing protein [Planctomycetia bacterium]
MRTSPPTMYAPRRADAATIVRVGVAVVVAHKDGRILLERRSDCGWWGLPGGRIDPGESAEQAAIREVFEETGLNVRITRLIGLYSEPEGRIVTYPDNVVQLVDVAIAAEIVSGRLTISPESLDLQYFEPAKLPDELVPPARRLLDDYAQGLFGVLR